MEVEIRDMTENNVNDALSVCTPEKMMPILSYRQGLEVRREWLLGLLRTIGTCCKIAYINEKPVGMIQFNPLHRIPYFATQRRDALYIHCIFVKHEFRNQGIGSKLLKVLINEMKEPNPLFGNKPCQVFVTTARERHGFRQPSYFRLKGFSKVAGNLNVGLLYQLSNEEQVETLDISGHGPMRVDERGVKIFYDPSCQYCIYFNEGIRKLVREFRPDVSIEEFDLWTQSQEALKRGVTSRVTYINGTPIIFQEPERFREAVREALQS
jgi:GNAT superfamily N-acetyltransferase